MNMNPDPVGSAGTPNRQPYNLRYLAGIALVASAGGFLFGYDLALIAGALAKPLAMRFSCHA